MSRKLLAIVLGACTTTVLAHEFWLEAPRFRLQPGATVNVHTFIGADFKGEPWTTKAAKIRRLVRYGPKPADTTDLTPRNFAATDTFRTAFTFAQPGTHLVLLQSTSSFIELPADQFTAYLREEGLDYPLKLRQENEETTKPGREVYSRCAKTLVQVGNPALVPLAADSACRHAYGLPLELVPEQNPYRLAPGAGAALHAAALRLVAGLGPFQLTAAHMAWEIRPTGVDKGVAVRTIMQLPLFAGRLPVFIGDDITDEDGMAAARELGGAGLFVPTVFGGAPGVRDWLSRCVTGWAGV